MTCSNAGGRFELRRSVAWIAIFGAAFLWTWAADAAPKALTDADRFIGKVRADWKNVGVAVAVVQGKDVIYARGFGEREVGKAAKVDVDTLFEIGSATKAFTAAAIGVLVDEGKIGWDDPVVKYLPGFQLQDPWLTRHLTLRDALVHRTGLADNFYPFLVVMNEDEAIQQLRYVTPQAEFRDSYRYNNLMYGVLGKVVEAVSGMTYQEFVRKHLLQPLGMHRSSASPYEVWEPKFIAPTFFGSAPAGKVSFTDARDPDVAMPHGLDESGAPMVLPWQSFENAAPAGSVVSSAADMAHWLILQLNAGQFADRQVLKGETVQEMHAAQNLRGSKAFPLEAPASYAMGWHRSEYRGHAYVAHGGSMLGFPSYVAMLPDRRIGVVVLSNTAGAAGTSQMFGTVIALGLIDRLLGAPLHDWNGELTAQARNRQRGAEQAEAGLRRSRLQNVPPTLPLEKYAGVYEDHQGHSGRVNVLAEDGKLKLRFAGEGAYCADLEHWHGDLFRLHSSAGGFDALGPQFVTFVVEATGQVAGVSLGIANLKLDLEKLGPAESSGAR